MCVVSANELTSYMINRYKRLLCNGFVHNTMNASEKNMLVHSANGKIIE